MAVERALLGDGDDKAMAADGGGGREAVAMARQQRRARRQRQHCVRAGFTWGQRWQRDDGKGGSKAAVAAATR